MTVTQQQFFTKLCADFPPEELRTRTQNGKTLTWITNRTLFNRLDDVAGPTNWYTDYSSTDRGFTCKLWINVPEDHPLDEGDGPQPRRWMFKADGGGYAGMPEKDNDEKSGYSDAAKRAGMVWGIARSLYKDGMPDYLDNAPPPASAPAPARQAPARQSPAPPQRQAPQRQAPQQGGKTYDNFRIPKAGRAAFAWAKGLEDVFGNGIVDMMVALAKDQGWTVKLGDWDQDQLDWCAWFAIEDLKTWESYQGQFDRLARPESVPDPQ